LATPAHRPDCAARLVNINATTSNIERATANLADVTGGFKNIVGDPQVQRDLKETAANLNGTLAATRAAAERVNSLLGGRNPRRVRTREEGAQLLKLQTRTAQHLANRVADDAAR
jgi:hypothetical protein